MARDEIGDIGARVRRGDHLEAVGLLERVLHRLEDEPMIVCE
jgi:hypothetical protein